MPRWPHLASCPDNFEDFADVVFVVGGQRLPAHSQYLAATSKLMQTLLHDAHTFSKQQPLILDQQLRAFSQEDLQTFVVHVYLNPEVDSAAAAEALLEVADLFDASKLMEKAVAYLEENSVEFCSVESIFASPDDILHWLMLAEYYKLPSLLKRCANHAAICYRDVCTHPNFDQLEGTALKAILQGMHLLRQLHPKLIQQQAGQGGKPLALLSGVTSVVVEMSSKFISVEEVIQCDMTIGPAQSCVMDIKDTGLGMCRGMCGNLIATRQSSPRCCREMYWIWLT